MASTDFPLITNRVSACYFSPVSLNQDGQEKGKKEKSTTASEKNLYPWWFE